MSAIGNTSSPSPEQSDEPETKQEKETSNEAKDLNKDKASNVNEADEKENKKVIKIDHSMLVKCFEENDFVNAEKIGKLLRDAVEQRYGKESDEYWSSSMEYIETQKRLKNDQIALKLYLELEALTIKIYGEEHENLASLFNNIAMLYYHTFQHGKSVPYFEKVLKIWEKIYPPNDQHIVITKGNIMVNRQMAHFDTECQNFGVKIIKKDFTRDLQGRKPQNNDDNTIDSDENGNNKIDEQQMAAFEHAAFGNMNLQQIYPPPNDNNDDNKESKQDEQKEDKQDKQDKTENQVNSNSDVAKQDKNINNKNNQTVDKNKDNQ